MSKYIEVDKLMTTINDRIKSVRKSVYGRMVVKVIEETPAADVVSREQYNAVYEENIRLRAELEKKS